MTFSKEDKSAWQASEIMQELEIIARNNGIDIPEEAYKPLLDKETEESSWEEEDENVEKLIDAVVKFEDEDKEDEEKKEIFSSYNKELLDNIEKISYQLADKSSIKAAYRIERVLQNIKALLEK
jgi:hypothetical protein